MGGRGASPTAEPTIDGFLASLRPRPNRASSRIPGRGSSKRGLPNRGPGNRKLDRSPGKERKRGPRWPRILLICGVVLVVISGIALVGVRLFISRVDSSVAQDNLLGDAGNGNGDPLSGALDILMIGLDARPGESEAASRADTIIVLHVPASHDRAYLVSVPRDLMVQVKPFAKSGFHGGRAKMTEAFFHGAQGGAGIKGGTELLALTIKDTLGVSFKAAAIINFESFIQVIEALGGVDMCFDQTVTSKHLVMGPNGSPINIENDPNGKSKGKPITYPKGQCRSLVAWEALDFSRQRYGLPNSDYDRQRHQQQLIKAIVKKATSTGVVTNPGKLNSVIKAAGAAFVVDTGGIPIADFAFGLKGVAANGLVTLRTNAGKITSQNIDGVSYENLTPSSKAMFQAVTADKLDTFVAAHPEFVSSS
jgi:LCP family protein required for cell wall assembly